MLALPLLLLLLLTAPTPTILAGVAGLSRLGFEGLAAVAMRSGYSGSLNVVRAAMDDPLVVGGKFIDSMALPYSFDDSCAAAGGCTSKDAKRLAVVTTRLMASTATAASTAVTTDSSTDSAAAFASFDASLLVAVACAAPIGLMLLTLAALHLALSLRRRRMRHQREAFTATGATPSAKPRTSPGLLLNLINQLAHLPLVAPLLESFYWASLTLFTPLLAPVILASGVYDSVCEAAR